MIGSVRTYLIMQTDARDYLCRGNYAWLPLNDERKTVIVFNISQTDSLSLCSRLSLTDYIYRQLGDAPASDESIKAACEAFSSKIERARACHENYANNYEHFMAECLKESLTGHHYYLYRTLLYGGLFNS